MTITREQYDAVASVIDAVKLGYSVFEDGAEMQDTDQYAGRILDALGLEDPYTPAPVSTINSIAAVGADDGAITINPVVSGGVVQWYLYIPPTTVDAFEFGENDEDYEPLVNDIKAPWGGTYWDTFSGALASLTFAYRAGQITFNDGRIVS